MFMFEVVKRWPCNSEASIRLYNVRVGINGVASVEN